MKPSPRKPAKRAKTVRVWCDMRDPCIVFPIYKFPKLSDLSPKLSDLSAVDHSRLSLVDLVPVASSKKRRAK